MTSSFAGIRSLGAIFHPRGTYLWSWMEFFGCCGVLLGMILPALAESECASSPDTGGLGRGVRGGMNGLHLTSRGGRPPSRSTRFGQARKTEIQCTTLINLWPLRSSSMYFWPIPSQLNWKLVLAFLAPFGQCIKWQQQFLF